MSIPQDITETSIIAHIKRFLEMLEGDPDFLQEVRDTPSRYQSLLDSAELALSADDLYPFWRLSTIGSITPEEQNDLFLEFESYPLWKVWIEWSKGFTDRYRQETSEWVPNGDKRLNDWRTRQIARVASDVINEVRLNDYPLFAFELSKGCSAQCWFCALDPPKFQGYFPFNDHNRILWREVLETARELFGPGGKSSVCYHATEPTDNPDYFQFLEEFHAIFSLYPQTTTSRPLKDLDWTRKLLALEKSDARSADRFSVLSPQALHDIHNTFTAEELLNIRLVIQKEGSLVDKALSGRTIKRPSHVADTLQNEQCSSTVPQLTIECTCGYLVNMVDKSIKLISPCNASEQWPMGYQIHKTGVFNTAADLREFINNSIEECMPEHLAKDDRIAFREGLHYEQFADGFTVTSRYRKHNMLGNQHFCVIGELLLAGKNSTAEVTDILVKEGMPLLTAISWLDKLYQGGLIQDTSFEPCRNSAH